MAATVKLYTFGNMKNVTIDTAPGEDSGYPIENAFDNNPDVGWKTDDGSANETIDLDLGESVSADAMILFLRNYEEITNARIVGLYRYPDDTYTTGTSTLSGRALVDTDGPFRIYDFSATASSRYWKVTIAGDSASDAQVPEISMIGIVQLWQPSIGSRYPEKSPYIFHNNTKRSRSGRTFSAGINSRATQNFERNFIFSQSSDEQEIYGAIADCMGSRYPVIIQEGSAQNDAVLCRFADDEYKPKLMRSGIWGVDIELIGEPWIPDGSNY